MEEQSLTTATRAKNKVRAIVIMANMFSSMRFLIGA